MVSKRSVLPLISIIVLFTIVCIIAITRGSLIISDDIKTSATVTTKKILENVNLNDSEKIIINMLKNKMKQQNTQEDMKSETHSTYIDCLESYLSSSDKNLSKEKCYEVVELIKSINVIMTIEKENDFKKMSLDGREVATHICEQIYQLCGLNIIYALDGDIVQITDNSGNFLYNNENSSVRGKFSIYKFVIVFIIWFFLLSICFVLAKTNQLLF